MKKIFKAKKDIDFFIVENRIVLSEEYKKKIIPKKITGSRFGDLFSPLSEVKTWMKMFSIYDEPFDEIYSNVGNEIENKLRNYYLDLTKNKIKNYNPKDVKWDVFHDLDIFGGIPDGEPLKEYGEELDFDNNNNRMLEIKTASIDSFVFQKENGFFYLQKENGFPIVKTENGKLNTWIINDKINIPNNYLFQLSLYMFLRKAKFGTFIIGFIPTYNYKFPKEYDVKNNLIKFVNYDLNLEEFNKYISFATNWWKTYIETGISPMLTKDDIEWLNEAYDN